MEGQIRTSRLRSADTRRRLQFEMHALVRWKKLTTTKRLSARGLPDSPGLRIRLLDGMCVASARFAGESPLNTPNLRFPINNLHKTALPSAPPPCYPHVR